MTRLLYLGKLPLLYLSKYFKGLLRLVPVKPYSVNVKITENCNSRCITCDMWNYRHENEYSTQEFEYIMEQMTEIGIKTIRFTGGEPLIRDDIGILIRKARDLGFKVNVATNGLLLNNKALEIIESGVTSINVSIDGLRETNDLIRGVPSAYDKSIQGIKTITQIAKKKGKKVDVSICSTLSRKNVDEIPGILKICRELGVKWNMNILDQNPYFYQKADISKLLINTDQLYARAHKTLEYVERFREENPRLLVQDSNYWDYVRNYLRRKVKEPPCMLAYTSLYLGSKGDVYSGCWVLKPIGNIRKNKMSVILQSEEYRKRAQEMFLRKCKGCTCGTSLNIKISKLPSTMINIIYRFLKLGLRNLGSSICAALTH